ncbi:MAG: hypothetical protein AB7H43_14475 [Acidimicrobiia bacterium]
MCRIDYADDEGGFWREEPHEVTARKDHRCGDCGRTIAKGEPYTRGVWLMPGEGHMAVSMCSQCVHAGRWLRKVCGGHFWPGVIEELQEHWDEEFELRSPGLARLLVATGKSNHTMGRKPWEWKGALVPVETVDRWVDAALAKVPAGAMH